MRKMAGLLALLALLLLQVGAAFAQSSDYEIIASYKKSHQALLESIKTAQDLGQCALLENEIGRLEGESLQHRVLLGEGLYPESFEASIVALRDQLKKSTERIRLAAERAQDKVQILEVSRKAEEAEKKIVVISTQNEKLTREVQELSTRIQQLSEENTGLLGKIKTLQLEGRKDRESIASLKRLTDKLNANIRDRDELIVKLMESLFDEYSSAGLTDAQKKKLLTIAQENDYVSKIVATVDGNIAFVETALLTPQDVKLIHDQQRRLSVKWDEIKPYVGKLYPDEQSRIRDITLVDGRLADLKRSLDTTTWKSIHQVFTVQNVAIDPFHNAGEFYTIVLAYIDGQLNNPSRETYRVFKNKIWDSPLKDQWLPIVPTEELSEKQRLDIEARIVLWDKKISAIFWRWALVGVFGAALIALVAVMVRRKKKPTAPA